MPEKDKKLIHRFGHGTAAVTVNSDCVTVLLFGGQKKNGGSPIADMVVLRFGKYGGCAYILVTFMYLLCLQFCFLK